MNCPEKVNPQKKKVDLWLPGLRGGMGTGFLFGNGENVLEIVMMFACSCEYI